MNHQIEDVFFGLKQDYAQKNKPLETTNTKIVYPL
jgi:hypothetical protein